MSLKQILKFSGERKHFTVWLMKATAACALKEVSHTLQPGFKDRMPVNDVIPLDKNKPAQM